VKLSIDLADQSRYNQSLRRQVEMVVANFEDGVVLTDKSQRITYHNAKALELLAQSSITGLKLGQVLPAGNLKDDGAFLSVNHRALHITRKAVDLPADNQTEMLIIKDLTSIRHIDEQFRKQKKYSGYTAKYTFPDIIHQSKSIKALIRKARALAETDSSVLMIGESGTGKELFAQSIHNASHRRGNPFVALNCAALSETLLESELFGYAEGAFTGARKGGKIGLFEMAHKGTIFLDEIGDAPLATQKKLLRVLQEKEIMRVAGDNVTPIDVRVIAATNKNLAELVAARQFREDLFYRLNVFPLYVPSLRERKDDINPLIEWFINKYSLQHKRSLPRLDPAIYRLLHDYEWPGNIRQLENIAEFIVTVSSVSDDLYSDVLQILTMSAVRHEQARPALAGQPEGRLRELRAILAVLNDNSSHRIGRSTIRKLLLEHGFSLSEQQIKTRLAALKKLHFVESDNGKGTMLAPAGCKYLEQSER
jgi:transcriptional regulator with PAS, ATPase and Fis domain